MPASLVRALRAFERLSLRLKLTVWMVAVFAAIQLTLALVFLLYQQASINEFFNIRLLRHAEAVAAQISDELPAVSQGRLREVLQQHPFVHYETIASAVYDEHGAPFVHSTEHWPATDSWLAQAIARKQAFLGQPPSGAREFRSIFDAASRGVAMPITARDGRKYTLVVVADDSHAARMLDLARSVLLWSVPLGIIAASAAGWLLASRAVAPLRRVARLMSDLSPATLTAPLPNVDKSSEVAEVTDTLEDARHRLDVAFAAHERFMTSVSHELKTPIATILTESQTLKLDGSPPGVRDFVRSTQDEMRRLGRLVESFLTLNRVRAGRSALRMRSCGVNDVLLEAVEHCALIAREHSVRLAPVLLDDERGACLEIRCEPELLRTMLDNLIRNAIRFSPPGARVIVAARFNGDDVHMLVRDHGPGVPPEMLDRIFEPYVQAANAPRRGRGHGLGLEIAQRIAELHGGSISVRNLPGGGCEFCVRLPIPAPTSPSR